MWRRVLAVGAAVAALAAASAAPATATPGSNASSTFTFTPLAGMSVATQTLTILPGGTTGWHDHPWPTIVLVLEGVGTLYHADCMSDAHGPGAVFMQFPGQVHTFRNEGSTTLRVMAWYLVPLGTTAAQTRRDQPNPGCSVN